MPIKYRDYINIFLFGCILFLLAGIVGVLTGISYSKAFGVFTVNDRVGFALYNLGFALLWALLDVIYVQLKRHIGNKNNARRDITNGPDEKI